MEIKWARIHSSNRYLFKNHRYPWQNIERYLRNAHNVYLHSFARIHANFSHLSLFSSPLFFSFFFLVNLIFTNYMYIYIYIYFFFIYISFFYTCRVEYLISSCFSIFTQLQCRVYHRNCYYLVDWLCTCLSFSNYMSSYMIWRQATVYYVAIHYAISRTRSHKFEWTTRLFHSTLRERSV